MEQTNFNIRQLKSTEIEYKTEERLTKLFQASLYSSFLEGNYVFTIPAKYLKNSSNFGLGASIGLSNEMILLDGTIYLASAYNTHVLEEDKLSLGICYAKTCQFNDKTSHVYEITDCPSYEEFIKKSVQEQRNISSPLYRGDKYFYAVKIEGEFNSITIRTFRKLKRPFRSFEEVCEESAVKKDYTSINGTLVGFYSPSNFNQISDEGFHFHFISENKSIGGHVLDFSIKQAKMKANIIDKFEVKLPSASIYANPEEYKKNLETKKEPEGSLQD